MSISLSIDWDAVYAPISAAKVSDWDKDGIGAAVVAAYNHWTQHDKEVIAVEMSGDLPFPYRIDLVLMTLNGVYNICDWKTKPEGKKLDERWAVREVRSLQHRLYAAALGTLFGTHIFPVLYHVRGISLEDNPVVKQVSFYVTEEEAQNAVRDLEASQAMRDTLITIGRVPWPKYESGCQMFGPMYECEFTRSCFGTLVLLPGWGDERRLSYSSRKEFTRCPERYRLLQVTARAEDEDRTAAGTAFHAAMEVLYKQLL